jgi:hypothetical protein
MSKTYSTQNHQPYAKTSSTFLTSVFGKLKIVLVTIVCVFTTAASCSLNPFASNVTGTLGIIKFDSKVAPSFGDVNTTVDVFGQNNTGLAAISIKKIYTVDASRVYILTKEKGIMRTGDGGGAWNQIYITPISAGDEKQTQAEVADNNSITIQDLWIAQKNKNIIYVAAKKDNFAKIYKTKDGGLTFEEIYSEVDASTSVEKVVVDPKNADHVYALLNQNALIQTFDAGKTWQKLENYSKDQTDKIIEVGTLPGKDSEAFYILYAKAGFAFTNDGKIWTSQPLTKLSEESNLPIVGDNFLERTTKKVLSAVDNKESFKAYKKIKFIPSKTGDSFATLLIADQGLWVSNNLKDGFRKLSKIPLQSNTIDINDFAIDKDNKIYAAIKNTIWISENGGQSWKKVNIEFPIGNVSKISIVIDSLTGEQVIYAGLTAEKL